VRTPILMAGMLLSATAAAAQDTWTWSGEAAIVSDYRWRGVSLTDNDPALQCGLSVIHAAGPYAGVWGSTSDPDAEDTEINLYVGHAFELGGGEMDLSVLRYIYPNLDDADYTEVAAAFEHPIGEWTTRARMDYAPSQANLSDNSFYMAFEVERPIGDTGLTLFGGVGRETGVFTLDGEKWDYGAGLRYQIRAVSFDLGVVGTDEDAPAGEEDIYDAGMLFSVKAAF
jgi:uncharacterized protein (TIGR02001 family)